MKRQLTDKILNWKSSANKKPLLIKGIRQSGKTWLLTEFGRLNYEDTAYFNFEKNDSISKIFDKDLEPKRILTELGVLHGKAIRPGKTIIIFDEIQLCSRAIISLKYFYESTPEYHIASAGSLLGIALASPTSYPVGKVDMMTLRPMNFYEYLLSNREDMLLEYLSEKKDQPEPIPDAFAEKLLAHLNQYYIVGGMPEAVSVWLNTKNISETENTQQNILNLFELDFAKYAPAHQIPKLSMIWNSIPAQLAKENGKFVYGLLRKGAGAREFEDAMAWLQNAGMAYKVFKVKKPSVSLKAYEDKSYFKLYFPDVGLLRKMANLSAKSILQEDRLYQEFKGAMAENFCLQELVSALDVVPHYWSSGNLAEIDFITQFTDKIIPIEVKAAENAMSKSLSFYRKKYSPPLSVKASRRNISYRGGLLYWPLYLLWRLPEMVETLSA
ncbi:MAG: ATP-binding protein [Actinobacteria bacterium]|nr:ATP-binding protein [Actinomycetota bacterium]